MCGSTPSPSPPPLPPAPPPAPAPADASVSVARSGAQRQAAGRANRAAAILTGPQGIVRPPALAQQTLTAAQGKQRLGA